MGQILFVTKDMGAVNACMPLADRLKAKGHTISVVSEGLSTALWQKADIMPMNPDNGFDTALVLSNIKPSVVVCGLSRPINIEDAYSKMANEREIPLVWVEDLWECHTRSGAVPNLIITLDEVGEELIRMDERFKGNRTRVVVSGNPAILKAGTRAVPEETVSAIAEIRRSGYLPVLLAGQGGFTSDIIRVACASVAMSSEKFVLIPRLHPKYLAEFGAGWKDQLDTFAGRHPDRLIELDPKRHTTDDLARLCEITLSTSSTTLLMAAILRKMPVSILTDITKPGMREIMTRLDRYPLVLKGAAREITEPTDLTSLFGPPEFRRLHEAQADYFSNWNTDRAVSAIEELLPR